MIKPNKLVKKDFISSLDMSTEEVNHIIDLATNLKNNDINLDYKNKVLGLIFVVILTLFMIHSIN